MEELILTGTVEGVIYRNSENGYSVLEIDGTDGLLFVAVGIMPMPEPGEKVELYGVWTEHKTYGKQFRVSSHFILAPTNYEDIENYLASGNIKGIGRSMAKLIVEKFGEDTFSILDNEPQELLKIHGIGKKKLHDIIISYNVHRANRTAMMEFQKLNISPLQATKIIKAYGDKCIEIVRKNPYRLIDDIENMGFKTADRIAQSAGIAYNSPLRISAGIKFILEWAKQEGHTYLPYDVLVNATANTLNVKNDEVIPALCTHIEKGILVQNTINGVDVIFLPYMRRAEMNVAVKLIEQTRSHKKPLPFELHEEVTRTAKKNHIELAHKQQDALYAIFEKGVSVITGGPGTGKTTILKIAIEIMKSHNLTFELCAPTGRAAKRMSAATGMPAQTIHRLLEYSFNDHTFMRDEDDPLDIDFLIIDEMSMVDISLMDAVLKALVSNTRIVLVGDADQLPSVGAGNVLRDILDSEQIFSVRLTEVYRQAAQSMIISNAHKINNGILPELNDRESDFNFYEIPDQNTVLSKIIKLFSGNAEGVLRTNDIRNCVQLLAPMKKGILGVKNLNTCLQNAMNPPHEYKDEITFGDVIFRTGDKVMQIKNNYSIEWVRSEEGVSDEFGKGIFNGDMGIITDVDKRNNTLTVTFENGAVAEYTHDLLPELNLAYCISIHKSQGSEFDVVVMALWGGAPGFFTRNLLYTAVTRAKYQVCILGRRECINSMVNNKSIKARYTALRTMLEEYACLN
ncbi:MAG: ATP-dependent RecD-like DNA helicase [Clostridia bacterium]|nr:ATP-dependent RecD-like DNA helicase [Clostridia bacterium]